MRAITAYSCIPLVNTRPWRGLNIAELHTQGIASAICYLLFASQDSVTVAQTLSPNMTTIQVNLWIHTYVVQLYS